MLRRLSTTVLRNAKTRGGGGGGGFWTEGKKPAGEGVLFGETPPAPGQSRKWESWESPWLIGYGAMFLMGVVIAYGKPEEAASIRAWAKPRALAELEEEDAIFAQLKEDPEHLEEVKAAMAAAGKSFDEYYDSVLARKELDVLKKEYAA